MQTSEVLNRAADLIEERGWRSGDGWQFSDVERPEGLCLEGALQVALGLPAVLMSKANELSNQINSCPAGLALTAYLGRDPERNWLFSWNDSQRAAERVIEVLRATALIEAAKENAETRESVSA